MKKITKFLIPITIVPALFFLPAISFAQGLVKCDNSTGNPCNFNALLTEINDVIHFILFYMAIPIAAIMFFYAGFRLVSSGGRTESRSKAKSIFQNALIGLLFSAAAWLIVKTILDILVFKGTATFFK